MVSAINTNTNYYQSYLITQNRNEGVNDNSRYSAKETAIDIFNDYMSFDNNNIYKALSYNDYVRTQKKLLKQEIIAPTADDASKLSIEEYENRKAIYYEKVNNFNFDKGFQDYLKNRGCQDETELQALGNCYESVEDLKQIATLSASSHLIGLNGRIHGMGRILPEYEFDKLFDGKSVAEIQNFLQSYDNAKGFEEEVEVLKQLINDSSIASEDKDLVCMGLDLYEVYCKKEDCEKKLGNEISFDYESYFIQKYQDYMFSEGGIDMKHFLKQYLPAELELRIKELSELESLLVEKNTSNEQTNIDDSFIATKIAQYRK